MPAMALFYIRRKYYLNKTFTFLKNDFQDSESSGRRVAAIWSSRLGHAVITDCNK